MIRSVSHTLPPLRLLLYLPIVLLTVASCRFGNKLPPTPAPLPVNETLRVGLETHIVRRGDIVAGVTFPALINLRRQVELFFEQDGHVRTIAVNSGDFVPADTVLAELDIDDLQIQLTEAEWDLEIVREKHAVAAEERGYATQLAEQEVKIAELTLASLLTKELDKPGSVPPEEMAKAEQALTTAQVALKRLDHSDELVQQKELITSEVNIQRLQTQIEQSRIVAPFAGNVYFIVPAEDALRLPAKAYEPLIRLVDPTSLAVEATVPETELELLMETMPVSISLNYRPGVVLTGTIQQLPFPFGTGGDSFVHITVPAAERGKLRVGGTVEVYAEVQRRENVLWLPPVALLEVGDQFYAFVQNGTSESQVNVQVGLRTDERVEIIAGLTENEVVVQK